MLLLNLLILCVFDVYGIWEDSVAWKILLRYVPMICLQFWDFPKNHQNREVTTFCSAAGFCFDQYTKKQNPAKAPPGQIVRQIVHQQVHHQLLQQQVARSSFRVMTLYRAAQSGSMF